MLDITYIRENPNLVKQNTARRGGDVNIDEILKLDESRCALLAEIEPMRAERNSKSKGKPSDNEIAALKKLSEEIKEKEEALRDIEASLQELMYKVPNLTDDIVPDGEGEERNEVIRQVGEKPDFSFDPKEHWEIGETLGIINMSKAAEVSGSRFAYIMGDLALLEYALLQYAFSVVTSEETLKQIARANDLDVPTTPFIPVIPPVMVRPEVMAGMGRLEPRDERYHIASDDLYLVGSAEHTLGPIHMNETLPEETLPKRYIGFSTAFRREAGSYGKDMKGIFRMHQFDKLEMESFSTAEQGKAEQDLIMAIQEYITQQLGIPYQVVLKCTGDMGDPDYREYDIESWMPGQGSYRETHTSDYMSDFQARRLNIKVKHADGTTSFAHTNDATAIAMSRTPIAIIENFQNEDGTVTIPEVLRPFMGNRSIIGPVNYEQK